jgi:hypothetical protein
MIVQKLQSLAGVLLFLVVTSVCQPCLASELRSQNVTAGSVTATLTIYSNGNDFVIHYKFKSPTYPVGCLSDFDFRYQLRAADGRVIQIDKHGLQGPRRTVITHLGGDCTQWGHGEWQTTSWLFDLYPNLASGWYSLYLTFAPHGTGQTVDFKPVRLHVKPETLGT